MTHLLLSSKLLETLCNETKEHPVDLVIPNVGSGIQIVCFFSGSIYLCQVILYSGLALRHKEVVLGWSDKTYILVSQLFSGANLSIFYIFGGGVHVVSDHFTKVTQIVTFGFGLIFSFFSALLWVDLKRKIIVSTLRFTEVKQVASSWTLRIVVILPGLIGLAYCLAIANTQQCVPFVSLYRRFCGFMLGVAILLFLVNLHYMRKTLNAMLRLKKIRNGAEGAESIQEAIQQIRLLSGFISCNVPPFAGYVTTVLATPFLEDIPSLYVVVLLYHGVVLLCFSQLIYRVFYHLRIKKRNSVNPRSTVPSKKSSHPTPKRIKP